MTFTLPDFHSHDPHAPLVSLTPAQYLGFTPAAGQLMTVGIHPWDSSEVNLEADLDTLRRAVADPKVVAVGEVGFDPMRGAPLDRQEHLVNLQAEIAREAALPMVFHVVRRYDLLNRLHSRLRPTEPWAVHGFRGKEDEVRHLAAKGIFISLGEHFNPEAARAIPSDLLLLETDTRLSDTPDPEASLQTEAVILDDVIRAVASVRGTSPEALRALVANNLANFLKG